MFFKWHYVDSVAAYNIPQWQWV